MGYNYNWSKRANEEEEGKPLSSSEKKLWKEIEDFLYPAWSKSSSYRGDLEYTVYVRLIQEFYQNAERMSQDDRESVPDAFERVKAVTEADWRKRRSDALETIKDLPDPLSFTIKDVRPYMYNSDVFRLEFEGLIEKTGYSSYGLTPKGQRST